MYIYVYTRQCQAVDLLYVVNSNTLFLSAHTDTCTCEAAHFFSREKKELSSGVVVYFALSL